MNLQAVIKEETKATSQHQITIPKKIWNTLGLEPGAHFSMVLTQDRKIVVIPLHRDSFELSDNEWQALTKLAHSRKNISKQFNTSQEALSYLKKL
jgi:AbrB family looped-hinge helix DNA binding protein